MTYLAAHNLTHVCVVQEQRSTGSALCVHREYVSMAQARNILGFGGGIKPHKEGHKGKHMHGVCFRERGGGGRERARMWESPLLLLLLAFQGSGQEAKKILLLSL